MRRGTTPTIVVKVSGITLSTLASCYITLKQGNTIINKTGTALSIDGDIIKVKLTQDETLGLKPMPVAIQLRALTAAGEAFASSIKTVPVEEILMGGKIS